MATSSDCNASSRWTYVEIEVIDAERHLRPTHICGTEIRFAAPPRLTSEQITIITRNGDRETTRMARVLPHHADAQQVPIELIDVSNESKVSSKLTA